VVDCASVVVRELDSDYNDVEVVEAEGAFLRVEMSRGAAVEDYDITLVQETDRESMDEEYSERLVATTRFFGVWEKPTTMKVYHLKLVDCQRRNERPVSSLKRMAFCYFDSPSLSSKCRMGFSIVIL
jgi:hypothetical protein